MRTSIIASRSALKEIEVRIRNFLTSLHFDFEEDFMIVKALTLEKVEVTIKFRPGVDQGKIVLQDATVQGALWLANLTESWILSKIADSLEETSKKVEFHDFHLDPDKLHLSFSPRKD